MMESTHVGYIAAFLAGLGSFLTPCVLPLVPSYVTYITGLSFAELNEEHPSQAVRRKAAIHSLLFIAGFTTVFVTISASFSYLGSFFQGNAGAIRKVGGVLVMLFGLQVTGLLPISALLRVKRIHIHQKPAGYVGTFIVGLAFAVGWTPCTGPIVGAILTSVIPEGKVWYGVSLLLAYSVGLGIPFFFSSMFLSGFLVLFNKFKKFIRLFEIATGVLLIIVGVLMFFNYLLDLPRLTRLFH